MNYILEHWEMFFAVIGIVGTSCTAIVKVFSGCKWAEKIVKICDWFSVVNTEENKAKIAKASEKIKKVVKAVKKAK